MGQILIKNGLVYDGHGKAPVHTDIRIKDDTIIQMGRLQVREDELVIDASGLCVTPGFIDIHRHCDIKPFVDKSYGDAMLRQGITTTVVGNCGISMTPSDTDEKKAKELYDFNEPVMGPAISGIHTFEQYLKKLKETELPVNQGAMIGTGAVRIVVKGFSDTPYTPKELDQARDLIKNAMELGALGASVGIMYIPECYTTTEEFAYILKPVGDYGCVMAAHIRGEGDSMVRSVAEVIEIARKAGCALEISHFKSCGPKNWRKDIFSAIQLIENARAEGMDITCDFYPYNGGSTSLTTMLPPTFVQGDMQKALKRLGTKEGVNEFRDQCAHLYDDWDNFALILGWERLIISGVNKEHNRKYIGMTVTEAAEAYEYEDAYDFAARLMHDEDGRVAIINMSMCQEDIDTVARLPYSMVISDSIYANTDRPHPRLYGAFPKIIREYVQERGLFTMEEAVHKMTFLPASRMRLEGYGELAVGAKACINIFSREKFKDHATYTDPNQYATGLNYCILNGEIAVKDDEILVRSAGRVILVPSGGVPENKREC